MICRVNSDVDNITVVIIIRLGKFFNVILNIDEDFVSTILGLLGA